MVSGLMHVLQDLSPKQQARFWTKVDRHGPGECWIWTANKHVAGYGVVKLNRVYRMAHRVAYALEVGVIPEGLELDHLCRRRECVNPDHLQPVTSRENILRGEGRAAKQARQTHCLRGHPLSGDNLITFPHNPRRRYCRECIQLRRGQR